MAIKPKHKGPGTDVPGIPLKAYGTEPKISKITPNSDRIVGGVAVTITGSNFVGDHTVTIGGVAATSVVVVSTTTITAVAPAHAIGVVDVVVTNSHGQSATLEKAFVYVAPFVTGIEPNHGVLAGGTTVLVRGGNFVSGSTITFGGVAATSVNFIDEQTYSCVTPAHAVGPVTVAVDSYEFDEPFYYTLLIRGEDIRRQPGITIQERMGNAPNTCTFMLDGQSYPPKAGEVVQITDALDSDRLLFAGVAQTIDQIYEDQTNQLAWQVTAADYTFWLNRRRPFMSFTNTSASDVVLALCAKYAPWVDTSYVQTNLCNISVSFDGTLELGACFTTIARMLGGGHWYLSYGKVLHFFRTTGLKGTPKGSTENPEGEVTTSTAPGRGDACTASVGTFSNLAYSATPGYLAIQTTFVYSNGVESGLSKLSNLVAFDGRTLAQLTNIPTGAAIGSITCVARRIYARVWASPTGIGQDPIYAIAEISDNTTTTFHCAPGAPADLLTLANPGVSFTGIESLPPIPFKTPPAGPSQAPGADVGSRELNEVIRDYFPFLTTQMARGQGTYQFKTTNIYEDGTESKPSPASANVAFTGNECVRMNVPVGEAVGGLNVVYRRVYASYAVYPWGSLAVPWSRGNSQSWWIIPDNTTTALDIGMGFVGLNSTPPEVTKVPQQQNDPCGEDGPYLEDNLPQPADLDENNDDLLRETPLTTSYDVSQVRNRIFVRGGGTVTVTDAEAGDVTIEVADSKALPPNGGDVIIGNNGLHAQIISVSGASADGSAVVNLASPLPMDVASGTTIRGVAIVSDPESQKFMGAIELDDDGNPTDGIHEYYIDDPSLLTYEQQVNRGFAELELFSMPIVQLRYSTRDPNTHPGRKVNVDLENPPVHGTFLIQSVTVDQIHDESDQLMPRYTAQASSVRFELEDLLVMIAEGIKPMSSPGSGDFSGATTTGIKERAVVESKTYTDTVTENFAEPSDTPDIHGGPVQVYGIQVDIDFARIQTLNSVPLELVAGQPGKIISPIGATFEQNTAGTTFNTGFNVFLVHEGLAVSQALTNQVAVSNATNRYIWNQMSRPSVTDGTGVSPKGLGLHLKGSVDVTNGSGTFRIVVVYAIQDALA